jgi:hypothetical protein
MTSINDPLLSLTVAARFIGDDDEPMSIYTLRAAVKRTGDFERDELGRIQIRRSVAERLRDNRRACGYLTPTPKGAKSLDPLASEPVYVAAIEAAK